MDTLLILNSSGPGDRAEGAEGELDNFLNNNHSSNASNSRTRKATSLEGRFSFLNLRRPRTDSAKNVERDRQSCLPTSNPTQTGV